MAAEQPSSPLPEAPEAEPPGIPKRIEQHVQGRMMAGLVELLPLLATIFVLAFLTSYADGLIRGLPFVEGKPWDFWGIGLIVLVVVFYIVGLAVSTGIGRRANEFLGKLIGLIPIVKTIFGVAQQATTVLTSQHSFTRVVFVEWPREGMMALGFVTGRIEASEGHDSLVLVYIPTIPNPTSGNMALVREDEVFETDLSVDAAMKLVFSGGIVLPQQVSMARIPIEQLGAPRFTGRFKANPE